MTYKTSPKMVEATRLTRMGRLAEATALIQKLLHGRGAATAFPAPMPPAIGGLDLAPGLNRNPLEFDAELHTKRRHGLGETLRWLAARAKAPTPPAAPEPVPTGASFTMGAYANAAGSRNYKLYIPSTRGRQQRPLIVMLHGCTQSADDFAAGTRMNALAEEYGCLVVYPEQPATANAKKCWNWFKPGDQRRDKGEPSIIAGITQQIMRDHPIDASRVYIAGLSAGGAAAAIMGEAYPDLYAATGVHSGLPSGSAHDVPSAFHAMRRGASRRVRPASTAPGIVFHGDRDLTVNPRNGEAIAALYTSSTTGVQSTVQRGQTPGGHAYSRAIHADASGRLLCEQWTIHGGGHAWAGGSPSGSYTDPLGPDASREMLRFFLEHRKA